MRSIVDEPNRLTSIVVLTRYPDIFAVFQRSVEKYLPGYPVYVVVDQQGPGVDLPPHWNYVQGNQKFSMTGNCNAGWRAVTDGDILYCGDDITFSSENAIEELQRLAYKDPQIGIIAPQVIGGTGCPMQFRGHKIEGDVAFTEIRIPFICVYIKRETIDKVGYMDEQFNEYGSDDVDYCLRIKNAGYKLALTPNVVIQHGDGTTTFRRNNERIHEQLDRMWAKFEAKWGHRNLY